MPLRSENDSKRDISADDVHMNREDTFIFPRHMVRVFLPITRLVAYFLAFICAVGSRSALSIAFLPLILASVVAWRSRVWEFRTSYALLIYTVLACGASYIVVLGSWEKNLGGGGVLWRGEELDKSTDRVYQISIFTLAAFTASMFAHLLNRYMHPLRLQQSLDALRNNNYDLALRHLLTAASQDDVFVIDQVLRHPASMHIPEKQDCLDRLLFSASQSGALGSATYLVEAGARPDIVQEASEGVFMTSIEVAEAEGHVEIVAKLTIIGRKDDTKEEKEEDLSIDVKHSEKDGKIVDNEESKESCWHFTIVYWRRFLAALRRGGKSILEVSAMVLVYYIASQSVSITRGVYMVSLLLLIALQERHHRAKAWGLLFGVSLTMICALRVWVWNHLAIPNYIQVTKDSGPGARWEIYLPHAIVMWAALIHLAACPRRRRRAQRLQEDDSDESRENTRVTTGKSQMYSMLLSTCLPVGGASILVLSLLGGGVALMRLGHIVAGFTVLVIYFVSLFPARYLRYVWPIFVVYCAALALTRYTVAYPHPSLDRSLTADAHARNRDDRGVPLILTLIPDILIYIVSLALLQVVFLLPTKPEDNRNEVLEEELPSDSRRVSRPRALLVRITALLTASGAVAAALVPSASAVGLMYLISSLLLFLLTPTTGMAWSLGLLSCVTFLAKYVASLPAVHVHQDWAAWVGFSYQELPLEAFAFDTLVLFLAVILHHITLSLSSTIRKNTNNQSWLEWFVNGIESLSSAIGVHLAVTLVLVVCVVRHNILAVLLIVLLAAYSLRPRSREKLLRISWYFLEAVLFLGIIFQYIILLGAPPSVRPISTKDDDYAKFYLIGGFRRVDLVWDIAAFLALVLAQSILRLDDRRGSRTRFSLRRLTLEDTSPIVSPRSEAIPLLDRTDRKERITRSNSFTEDAKSESTPLPSQPPTPANERADREKFVTTAMVAADKFAACVIIIVVAATGFTVLAAPPLLFAAALVLGARDLSPSTGSKDDVKRAAERRKWWWELLQAYNFFVVVTLAAYQMPFVPDNLQNNGKSTVEWTQVIGISKLSKGAESAILHPDAIRAVLIFLLVDALDRLFWSKSYKVVIKRYQSDCKYAPIRSNLLEITEREREAKFVAQASEDARRNLQRLAKIREVLIQRIEETQKKKGDMSAEDFLDEETWPSYPKDDDYLSRKVKEARALERRAKLESERDMDSESDIDEKDEKEIEKKDEIGNVTLWTRTKDFVDRMWKEFRQYLSEGINDEIWILERRVPKDEKERIILLQKEKDETSKLPFRSLFWRWLVSHTEAICHLSFIMLFLSRGSFMGMVPALASLLYAIPDFPRPPKGFWRWAHAYIGCLLIFKAAFQIPFFCVTSDGDISLRPNPKCKPPGNHHGYRVTSTSLLGLRNMIHGDMVFYIIFELIALVCIAAHRHVLGARGLWREATRMDTNTNMNRRYKGDNDGGCLAATARSFVNVTPKPISDYYKRIFTPQEGGVSERSGTNVYPFQFALELTAAVYLIFFYGTMASPSSAGIQYSLSSNRFSGEMVLFFLAQVTQIILNRVALKRRLIALKLVLLYGYTIFWIYFIVFAWPQKSRIPYVQNPAAVIFLMLQVGILAISAMQVRYGFPVRGSISSTFGRSRLSQDENNDENDDKDSEKQLEYPATRTGLYIFRVYRAIPFVFEMRTMLDWTVTTTSLDMWETLTLEDIYANMWIVQCDLIYHRQTKRGEKQNLIRKITQGVVVLLVLLVILFGPLLLFSSANPVTENNNVRSASLTLSLQSPIGSYKLVDISSTRYIRPANREIYDFLDDQRKIDADDSPSTVQEVCFGSYADNLFSLTPPAIKTLTESLRDESAPPVLKLYMNFVRPGPAELPEMKVLRSRELSEEEQKMLASELEGEGEGLRLAGLVPAALRLPATGKAGIIYQNDTSFTLKLNQEGEGRFWSVTGSNLGIPVESNTIEGANGIRLVTVSNEVYPRALSGYSVIGLYTLIIVTIGNLVRLQFSGQTERIMYRHLMDATILVQYCECIKIARRTGQLVLEEQLFRQLSKILRTPHLLLKLTRRRPRFEDSKDLKSAASA